MPEPETVLAMAAATTFVAAMATSAWQEIRSGIVGLFRRRGKAQQSAVAAQLDSHAALVAEAEDSERARQGLVTAWQLQLEALMRQDPAAESDLRAVAERARTLLPSAQQAWVQTNVARDGGKVFAAQGGNVIVHQVPPGQAEPPGASADSGETGGLP